MPKYIYTIALIIVLLLGATAGYRFVAQAIMSKKQNQQTTQENTATTTITVIDQTELAGHNTPQDCWVAYQGKVYDLTNWLAKHPGGAEKITPFCGTAEAFSERFSGKHGTSTAEKLQKAIADGFITQKGLYAMPVKVQQVQ